MTDRQLLETILKKMDNFEKKQDSFEKRQDTFEKKQDIFEKKQNESSEILSALRHASEVQKAQYDQLKFEVAKLSGEIKKGIEEITEMQKSILEMYGSHEAEIRSLKRRPV
jgi:predicted  nucleic acid-binding Zn-ribbon protein